MQSMGGGVLVQGRQCEKEKLKVSDLAICALIRLPDVLRCRKLLG